MLSPILIRDYIAEVANRPKFSALTDTQKLQRLNGLCRRISSLSNAANRKEYDVSTVAGAVLSGGAVLGIRSDDFSCDIAGTLITFSSPITGEYTLIIVPLSGIGIDAPLNLQTANGFTAYGVDDGATGVYHAIPKQ